MIKRPKRIVLLLLAVLALGPLCSLADSARPNILFIAVDDLRPELGAYGAPLARTPNMDRLAESGLRFDRAYVSQAICAASRAALLTGLRPETTGIFDLVSPVAETVPDAPTLPGFFKANGYETISIGKVYHHRSDDPDGWSRPNQDRYEDDLFQARKKVLSADAYRIAFEWNREHPDRDRAPPWEAPDVGDGAYPDGANTSFAIQELHRLKFQQQRFFMVVGYHRPHLGFNAPKRYWDLYDPADIELTDVTEPPVGAPPWAVNNSGELRNYALVPQGKAPFGEELTRTLHHGYLACVSYVDALIGDLLGALEELRLADDTIVVLWGDHGYKLGEYGQFNKHTNFEIDNRVPLIVRVPGMRSAGRATEALVETVDLFPTLAGLAGLEAPRNLEGTSFEPLLADPDRDWKSAVFHLYPRKSRTAGGPVMGYAVRTANARYVEWRKRDTDELVATELYDLLEDPAETVNRSGEPAWSEFERGMRERLLAGWRAAQPRQTVPNLIE